MYIYINLSYHYALHHKITQVAQVKHGTGVMDLRPTDG